jgi:hypothetical protein
MASTARKVPSMALMNNLNKTPANQEYRPILRVRETEEAPVWSQQTECACPELCQIDHDN